MNPGDQREPGIFGPRNHLPKILNCAGLNKAGRRLLVNCHTSARCPRAARQRVEGGINPGEGTGHTAYLAAA